MPRVVCDDRGFVVEPGANLLDALLRAGLKVASSCRAGACQACLVQATRGTPPVAAQAGLKATQRDQRYFLACQARVTEDLELSLDGARALTIASEVESNERLAPDVVKVVLRLEAPLPYRAGQYVTLVRADGLARAYSIANPSANPAAGSTRLELHVRVLENGRMSTWLARPETLGARLALRGPVGECCYIPGKPDQPLLLAGTGTGLAPLWGVLHEALAAGHRGPIELWHGARTAEGLYLMRELEALARAHPQLRYRRCVLQGAAGADAGIDIGSLDAVLLASTHSFAGRRVFLCGDPTLVQQLKRKVFLLGASLPEIFVDAFVGTYVGTSVGTAPPAPP